MRLGKSVSVAMSAAVLASGAFAQDVAPQRLGDLRTEPEPRGSNATQVLATPTRVFMIAEVDNHGPELVVVDRATGEPTLRMDLSPGPSSPDPQILAASGDSAVFKTTPSDAGVELWTSDGTAAGTVRRLTIPETGTANRFFRDGDDGAVTTEGRLYVRLSGHLLLSEDSGVTWTELTAASASTAPTAFDGSVLFQGHDSVRGFELWISDGTVAGTAPIADLSPGQNTGAFADGFARLGDGLVFSGTDGASGTEPWYSDGTAAGTRRIADLTPGAGSSKPSAFFRSGAAVFFLASADDGASRALWRTDGTAEGTTAFQTDVASAGFRATVGGRALYTRGGRRELWATDGTAEGSAMLLSFASAALPITHLGVFGGRYLFAGDPGDGTHDVTRFALFSTDGTAAGTVRVDGVTPSATAKFPDAVAHGVEDGLLYLAGNDAAAGVELFESDGTAAGTRLLSNLEADVGSSNPAPLGRLPGALDFTFIEDGRAPAPARLVFAATGDAIGRELWITDGTAAGTELLLDLRPGSESSDPQPLADLGGLVIFSADDGVHGREPWITDGTPGGTLLLKDVRQGAAGSDPRGVAPAVSSRVVFFADDGPHGLEPWVTDGTPDGTRLLADTVEGTPGGAWTSSRAVPEAARMGSRVYFLTTDPGTRTDDYVNGGPPDPRLWSSDGTPAGTTPVAAVGSPYDYPATGPVATQGRLCGVVSQGSGCFDHQWSSTGTARATALRRSIGAACAPRVGPFAFAGGLAMIDGRGDVAVARAGRPFRSTDGWLEKGQFLPAAELVASGDRVILAGNGTLDRTLDRVIAIGDRLVVSDGTRRGTRVVSEVSFAPHGLRPLGGRTYFTATTSDAGEEPWVTDGTGRGTARLADVRTGPESSSPSDFALLGRTLVFAADDGSSGREPWSLAAVPTPAVPSNLPGDDDADGFPDLFELYFDLRQARVRATVTDDVRIDRFEARLDFAEGAKDWCILEGSWHPPDGGAVPSTRGATAGLGAFAASAQRVWSARRSGGTLRARPGEGSSEGGGVLVRVSKARNGSARLRFRVEFRDDFSPGLAEFGIDAAHPLDGEERVLPVMFLCDGSVASTWRTVRVTVAGTKGRWRL